MKGLEKTAISLCLLLCAVKPTVAQSIHGRILVEGDTVGMGGAELALIDPTGVSLLRVQTIRATFRWPGGSLG